MSRGLEGRAAHPCPNQILSIPLALISHKVHLKWVSVVVVVVVFMRQIIGPKELYRFTSSYLGLKGPLFGHFASDLQAENWFHVQTCF